MSGDGTDPGGPADDGRPRDEPDHVDEALDGGHSELVRDDEGDGPTAPLTTRWALTLFQSGQPTDDDKSDISFVLVSEVRRLLPKHGLSTKDPQLAEIDIWLETPGGDAHAAYKLMLLLRAYASRLRVVIPDRAKSAGTLLALGADEIYMAPAAELGPLDAQIHHEEAGIGISAQDMAKSVDYFAARALEMTSTLTELVEQTGITRQQGVEAILKFGTGLFSPVLSKLDPAVTYKYKNEMKVAWEYATRLLEERTNKTQYDLEIARVLVEDYPHHAFVISKREAEGLGLPVFPIEEYEYLKEVDVAYGHYEGGDHTPVVDLHSLGQRPRTG